MGKLTGVDERNRRVMTNNEELKYWEVHCWDNRPGLMSHLIVTVVRQLLTSTKV